MRMKNEVWSRLTLTPRPPCSCRGPRECDYQGRRFILDQTGDWPEGPCFYLARSTRPRAVKRDFEGIKRYHCAVLPLCGQSGNPPGRPKKLPITNRYPFISELPVPR